MNVLNDSTGALLEVDRAAFSFSLWSLCGVEPVSEQCAPSFDLPTQTDPTCNPSSVFGEQTLYSRVLCRAEFIDSIDNELSATDSCQMCRSGKVFGIYARQMNKEFTVMA